MLGERLLPLLLVIASAGVAHTLPNFVIMLMDDVSILSLNSVMASIKIGVLYHILVILLFNIENIFVCNAKLNYNFRNSWCSAIY